MRTAPITAPPAPTGLLTAEQRTQVQADATHATTLGAATGNLTAAQTTTELRRLAQSVGRVLTAVLALDAERAYEKAHPGKGGTK